MRESDGEIRFPAAFMLRVTTATVVALAALGGAASAQEGAGDFDNDCVITEDDFLAFLACRGGPTGGLLDPECWRGDLDGDGDVDIDDLHAFQELYGSSLAGQTGACCLPDDTCV